MSVPSPVEVELQKLRDLVERLRREVALREPRPALTLIQGGKRNNG